MKKIRVGDEIYVPSERSLTTCFPHVLGGLATVRTVDDTHVSFNLEGRKYCWIGIKSVLKRQKDGEEYVVNRKAQTTDVWPYDRHLKYWPRTKGIDY